MPLKEYREKCGLYDPAYEHDACGVGFTADIKGRRSHKMIQQGVQILCNLEHRGAVGGDQKTGDGAGMLLQMPHKFLKKAVDFKLPDEGNYGAGVLFLPQDAFQADKARKMTEKKVKAEGFDFLGWREVPLQPDCLGEIAREGMPLIYQLFVAPGKGLKGADGKPLQGEALERKLYILRKSLDSAAKAEGWDTEDYYSCSLSSRVMVYKGMFVSNQFETFYPDLTDEDFESALVLVHQRYSTNTFPSWPLAQPFRMIAHNGEINTLRRNVNNMTARETTLASPLFGEEITKLFPVTEAGGSDSAAFDSVLELLALGGRSLEHSVTMMVPEAFGARYHMSQDKRAFFEYHAAVMEPWDGPAAIAFTDGIKIGATLDRNGLRPGRYVITKGGQFVLASEVGVLEFPAEEVLEKGRLSPGKMILVDTAQGRVMKDTEIKSHISRREPYRRWLSENKIELKGLFGFPHPREIDFDRQMEQLQIFGYTLEDIRKIIAPMTQNAQEPVGSMGNDSALAVLAKDPQLLYNYFRQMFAQVTNPPIDPYRENLVMSLMSFVGRERNLLEETPEHCHQLKLPHPILTNDDIQRLKSSDVDDFEVRTLSLLFEAKEGEMETAVERVCREAEDLIDQGASLIILSDRGVDKGHAAVPALLAVSAVHHELVRRGKRHRAGLIIETGEAREVHHFATLIGYGASGINPYLVLEALPEMQKRGYIDGDLKYETMVEHYITSLKKGLLKVMSKMGVSTIRSYRGAQIYDAVGISEELVEKYFTNTSSQVGGIGLDVIERETLERHAGAYQRANEGEPVLPSGGWYNLRREGGKHLFTAEAVKYVQQAVREGDYEKFKLYSRQINDNSRSQCTLRGLFKLKKEAQPLPLEEVESEESIAKRFVSSAMSFGSLSKEAHEAMAIAMNRLGAHSNSGEGGEAEERYKPRANGDNACSRVKQVASGRFGVHSAYLAHCDELQIKMAQGAKPGEGGQLPGHKVNEVIAQVRSSTPGVMLISPPPHHDIYSIEDLSQLIFDLKNANPQGRVSVKLVSEVGVGTVAAGVAKGKADMVLISGSDGGTGASPLSSLKHAGSYWEIGLAETQQVLVKNKLRNRIRVQVDGQIKTGRDVVIGALLGAEEFGFGTTSLVSLGCIIMRKCHANSCPVGIATQRPELRKRFAGKPEHLMNFMLYVAREARELMAELGFRTFDEMVGRVDRIEVDEALQFYKSQGLDFSKVLMTPQVPAGGALRCVEKQEHDFSLALDPALIEQAKPALEEKKPVKITQAIQNCNRTVGTTLSYEVARRYGTAGLPDDTIHVKFDGSAGQSFGAFLSRGVTFELEGDANDYFGKGLSGGRMIVYPPKKATFRPERNIITGNVNFFGATSGEAYIHGMAGERFCVRNSGVTAVVEGVGDHGCEYMTGGEVVILGETGVNFAAGMSGGIAYVLDENQLFDTRCNLEMVDVEPVVEMADRKRLKELIINHKNFTGSGRAAEILERWEEMLPLFVKVMPLDYRRALELLKEKETQDTEVTAMTEEVYS